MLTIKCLTLDNQQGSLHISLASDDEQLVQAWTFSFEFLRVISLAPDPKAPIATHKKQVQLTHVESVGKHGFRFCFDDGFTAIYNVDQLALLHNQAEQLWQQYLAELKKSGHTREATINITQL